MNVSEHNTMNFNCNKHTFFSELTMFCVVVVVPPALTGKIIIDHKTGKCTVQQKSK